MINYKLEIYKADAVLKAYGHKPKESWRPGKKQEVKAYSYSSEKRARFVAINSAIKFAFEITLTYPAQFPYDDLTSKNHLIAFKKRLIRAYGVEMFWKREWQTRGAVHFHILISRGRIISKRELIEFCRSAWFEIVGSDDINHYRAGTSVDSISDDRHQTSRIRYITRYLAKRDQTSTPDQFVGCGRFWGCTAGVRPLLAKSLIISSDKARQIKRMVRKRVERGGRKFRWLHDLNSMGKGLVIYGGAAWVMRLFDDLDGFGSIGAGYHDGILHALDITALLPILKSVRGSPVLPKRVSRHSSNPRKR